MARSYLYIKSNDYQIYYSKEILTADAIIIDIYDAYYIFTNFELFEKEFNHFLEIGMEIYLKLDTKNLKETYKILKYTQGKYLTGWAIPHASDKILNRLMIKAREYELTQKLNFGSLSFIAIIDTPEGIIKYRKIAGYERVRAINIDEKAYTNYLGLNYFGNNYLRNQVALSAAISKKPLIDSMVDSQYLETDLRNGEKLGVSAKATSDLRQLSIINDFFTPSSNEIIEAREIIDAYLNASKKERKNLIVNNHPISQYKVVRCQEILNRAEGLINSPELIVRNEKVFDRRDFFTPKKFYTFGEEIGNAISHGVGIAFSIIFLILLLIKGINEGQKLNIIAYVIYSMSAFILYFCSTMYHGLPLGSKSKRLFNKFDHMSIYLLIAGTYTPLTLVTIGGNLGIGLFIFLWVGATIGFILNLFFFGKFKLFHMFLYVALGWVAIFYIKTITQTLGTFPTILLISGGVAYTVGIVFYSLKLFKFTHMVWHLFVILGSILHFLTIYLS